MFHGATRIKRSEPSACFSDTHWNIRRAQVSRARSPKLAEKKGQRSYIDLLGTFPSLILSCFPQSLPFWFYQILVAALFQAGNHNSVLFSHWHFLFFQTYEMVHLLQKPFITQYKYTFYECVGQAALTREGWGKMSLDECVGIGSMRKASSVLGGKGSWNLGLIAKVSPFGRVQASEMWQPVKRLEALVREKWPLGTLDGALRPLMTAPWVLIYEAVVRGTQRATNHTGYEIVVQQPSLWAAPKGACQIYRRLQHFKHSP